MARAESWAIVMAITFLSRQGLADVPAAGQSAASAGAPATAVPAPGAPAPTAPAPTAPSPAAPPQTAAAAPPPTPVSTELRSALPPAPPAPPPLVAPPPPTDAIVHLAVNYASARLEGRSLVDMDAWRVLCAAPCDTSVRVEGLELRVTAPRMTTTNVFLVAPGAGTARFRVSGGSKTARELGIIGLVGGLPVAFVGMTLFGLGSVQDSPKERTAGVVTLAVGAALTVIALPFLVLGSSSVKNEQGKYIARRATRAPLL